MRSLHRSAAVAVLVAAAVALPCTAQAAFSSRAVVSLPVATATLAVPGGAITATCDRNPTGPYHSMTLIPDPSVPVRGATGYEVVLTGPAGEHVTASFDMNAPMVIWVKKKGEWTFAVRAVHTATASNVWTGPLSEPRTVPCDRADESA
jgi:hypothetical protein